MFLSTSGWNFFGFSSDYRSLLIDEFYVLSRHTTVTYSDFLTMPSFMRRYLIEKLVTEFTKND
jgi:hypothetical protein